MPQPPSGIIKRLNYVIDFLFDPCDAPFTLYVKTALPAILEAAIFWFLPVPDEIFTAWARPSKAIARYRSARKGTRGSKAGKHKRGSKIGKLLNFDVNEYIGKRLPGAELLGKVAVNGPIFFLWRMFGLLQLFGFLWMVWEVISGFFVRWFSLLYETEYCRETTRAILDSWGDPYVIGSVVEDNAFLALNINKQRGNITVGPGGGVAGVNNVTVVVSATANGVGDLHAWLDILIWPGTQGVGQPLARARTVLTGDASHTVAASASYPAGGQYTISLRTNVTLLTVTETTLYVQGGAQT